MNKFIILSSQRTGSTYLRKFLSSHPMITCCGELFIKRKSDKGYHPDRFYHYLEQNTCRRVTSLFKTYRQKQAEKFLDHFWKDKEESIALKGFKLMYNQAEHNQINLNKLASNDVKIIHLVRENLLKKYISGELVKIRHTAHSENEVQHTTLVVDTQRMIKSLRMMTNRVAKYNRLLDGMDVFQLSYEEYFNPQNNIPERIFDFFSVPYHDETKCNLKKLTSDDLTSIIENLDEVENSLNKNGFGYFLCLNR